jgi:hypothetical protein
MPTTLAALAAGRTIREEHFKSARAGRELLISYAVVPPKTGSD